VDAVKRFANYWGRRPDLLGAEEVRWYQIWLRDEQHVSWSFFNQTAGALRFFYTHVLERPEAIQRVWHARRERKLPVVLSEEELVQFLEAVTLPRYRAMLTTMYSCGLRLSETLHLRVEDIHSARMVIRVRRGKGKKDRYVPLSPIVLDLLRAHWRSEKPRGLLFPNAADPERPMNDGTVQRYVQKTARRAGLTKRVTPHTLRHSYATHLMEQGTSSRVIQVLLGHSHVRTTESYMHVSPQTLRDASSPIDRVLTSRKHD
jgi:site-specific recombinase XerD